MKKLYEDIYMWVMSLRKCELREALNPLIAFAIEAEEVSFWEDSENPHYSNTGEPLVVGRENE